MLKRFLDLPERFDPKVVAIEESSDLDSLKVDQLVGNMQTFEANLRKTKKAKGMALKSLMEHENDSEQETEDPDLDALFVKKFKKFLKNDRKDFKKNFKSIAQKGLHKPSSSFKSNAGQNSEKNVSKIPPKSTHCFECKGFGHYASQCVNRTFRTQGKVLNVTWDDDSDQDCNESEPESSSPEHGKFMAFMARSNDSFVQKSVEKSDEFTSDDLNCLLDNEQSTLR